MAFTPSGRHLVVGDNHAPGPAVAVFVVLWVGLGQGTLWCELCWGGWVSFWHPWGLQVSSDQRQKICCRGPGAGLVSRDSGEAC